MKLVQFNKKINSKLSEATKKKIQNEKLLWKHEIKTIHKECCSRQKKRKEIEYIEETTIKASKFR
jgi:hypothetical protein